MAIAFGTTGSTVMTSTATSATVDITSATAGDWVYCWVAISTAGTAAGTVSATGWTSLLNADEGTSAHYALLRRQKQVGDTTFSFGWTNSAKGVLGWASWSGLDSVTPDEGAALATNGTTSRTAVPTPSATPTAANRWAAAFFGARTTTAGNKPITWTPDAATTERLDIDNNAAASSPWTGLEIADTNAAVTQAAHSYTATHNAAESHDGSAILFLIPGATTVNGTASLTGAGSLAANVTELAPAALAGAGTLTTTATQRATASPAGAGSLAANATQGAPAALTGVGSLTVNAVTGPVAAVSGAGSLSASATFITSGTASLVGAGVLTAASGAQAPGSLSLSTAAGRINETTAAGRAGTSTTAGGVGNATTAGQLTLTTSGGDA